LDGQRDGEELQMYVVGTDRVVLVDGQVLPNRERHAVDVDGVAVCQDRPVRYTFPGLRWSAVGAGADDCSDCATLLDAPDHTALASDAAAGAAPMPDAYPDEPVPDGEGTDEAGSYDGEPAELAVPDSFGF
jgi:hypothetical protein